MRRVAVIVACCLLISACATPKIGLRPVFSPGEVREYRLVADAVVRITSASGSQVERSRLVASTRLAIESVTNGVATVLLTITPRSLTRDGKSSDRPPAQQVRLTVSREGRVTDVKVLGGQTALEAADVEDLVPLLGPPLPPGRVHLADRWTRRSSLTQGGTQQARLAALRVVDGYDCAIVATSTRRPVSRQRQLAGSTLRLDGVEYASGEIAFAFGEGFPVTVKSDAEARLAVSGAGAQGGAVVISTVTTLTLARRALR